MQILKKITTQTLWQILGKVVTSLATFIILAMVARNYGEAGTGIYTLSLTYLAIFYLLSDFGFNAHMLRKLKVKSEQLKVEWQRLLGTRLMWSAVLAILAIGLLPFWPFATAEFTQAVALGALAIVATGIFVTCNLIFQSRLRYDLSVLASSLGTVVGLAAFVYLVLSKYPVPILLLAHFSGWLVIAIAAVILLRKMILVISPIFDIPYTIDLFKLSWPIGATLVLNVVYFRADSFMISIFRSNAEVGIYNLAYAVFQTALVLPTFIMNSYYPLMLKSLKGIKFIGLGLLALAFLGTLVTAILAPVMIKILTGEGFVGSAQSLQILALGLPAYFLSALLMWILVTKGRYKIMLAIYTLGLVFNLSLNFIYIPQYSFLAASWITVISEYLILGMQLVSLRLIK